MITIIKDLELVVIASIKAIKMDTFLKLVVIITKSLEVMELVAITASTTVLELVHTSTITEDTEVSSSNKR